MKAFILLTFVICSALAIPTDVQSSLVVRQSQGLDIFSNMRRLIEELVQNLLNAANQALEAIRIFETGLLEQANLIRVKILDEVQKLRERVTSAIQGVVDKISGSGEAVQNCINSHRSDANALLNDTLTKTLECADERIAEIGVQIENLKNTTNGAIEFANTALDNMKQCVEDNPNSVLKVGSCLGSVAVQTEVKGVVFATQSGISIARLNLALATIPAALEVCAGSNLVAAGLVTAKIIMEIGSCSASSVFTTLTENSV